MKRNIWDAIHRCTQCNSRMTKKTFVVEGMNSRGWECVKCRAAVLHPEDAQKMLLFTKLKKGMAVRVGELGKSLVVRIPKDFAGLYKLSKGEQITIKAETDTKIEIEMKA